MLGEYGCKPCGNPESQPVISGRKTELLLVVKFFGTYLRELTSFILIGIERLRHFTSSLTVQPLAKVQGSRRSLSVSGHAI
jgi:hypothetical protein